jgi:hypothetical protein
MANVAHVRSIGLKERDKMEMGLFSNQDIAPSLPKTCMQNQNCLLDPLFGSIVKSLGVALTINYVSLYGMHPNFPKIPK